MVEEATPPRAERKESPYSIWQKAEGIPLYQGAYIDDMYTLELAPWARLGQQGAIINLANQEHDDGWIIEIAPGGQTLVQHHLFEATVFVLSGRGATMFWQDSHPADSVEWQRGSISHRHSTATTNTSTPAAKSRYGSCSSPTRPWS